MVTPSGRHVTITHGDQQASITEVGATLRAYTAGGRAVIDGFGAGEMSTAGRGQVLIPWPNRIEDGRYDFGGEALQLALTEPHASNAIHGLVRCANWLVDTVDDSSVSLTHVLHAQPGYPFVLDLRVTYALDAGGLTSRIEAVNAGPTRCPFGAGAHPYVRAGAGTVDAMMLRAPAATAYESDGRGIPIRRDAVDANHDFRVARPIGPTELDTAFTDLERDDGRATVEVSAGDEAVSVWMDRHFTHLMLFTGDTLSGDARRRSLAVEPMTCAPNAFRSGDGLIVLEPGEQFGAEWGIVPRGT